MGPTSKTVRHMATGGTSRWTVTVFSMRNFDLTAARFRLLYRYLSRSTSLAILTFTTLGAIVTCIALVTHWLSAEILYRYTIYYGLMTFMSNAAGRERDQFGTRMSAGLDWSLGKMPLPFSICGERHVLWQKSAMQSLSWLCLVITSPAPASI